MFLLKHFYMSIIIQKLCWKENKAKWPLENDTSMSLCRAFPGSGRERTENSICRVEACTRRKLYICSSKGESSSLWKL